MPQINFTHPSPVGYDALHAAPLTPPKKPFSLHIATHNLQDGRNSRLTHALRAVQTSSVDFAALTETRFPNDVCTKHSLGCDVTATHTIRQNQGGKADQEGWSVESTRKHGPNNVMSCELVVGDKRTPMIGAHIPPADLDTLPRITEALARFPNQSPLLLGDLSADMTSMDRPQDIAIADFLSNCGLDDGPGSPNPGLVTEFPC